MGGPARLTVKVLQEVRIEIDLPEPEYDRPKTRAECRNGPRPCPWVGCKYHLYADVAQTGSIRINHPGKELWELAETCALDVADWGGASRDETAFCLGVTKESVRQQESKGLRKVGRRLTKERP